ncbi:hypothetical protein PY650_31970 [Rhizobium calliandrae]|uniref:Uncharacterized protein n=1 Tax=Rhizobium calliandrae TaxID=1312182 RepID=A0ABT7KNI7_9HYPH|nr:hypothetical protein [Rhizobium calliandrae]MDL2410152.1 hypothetical protein [Rhizobium calliandrae]
MLDGDQCRSDMIDRRTRRQESQGTHAARILARPQGFRQQDIMRATECFCVSTAALFEPKAIKNFDLRRSLIASESLISFGIEPLCNGTADAE